jgi:DNA repair protein SbcC/Rad50
MIPESLRLHNFLSHRETDLDLRSIHVASLVGENGAGKSALLDAITWAVWGRSRAPYGREEDLIYHGESDVEVEFIFSMPYQSGKQHRYRILRRREQRGRRSIHSMLDFEVETEQGWRILTSDSMRETQQHIIEHLGLDYDTFINSAYLRQGHADEFTVQTASQRKQVLGTILGLERWAGYQEQARTRLSASQGRMKELDRRLEDTELELARRPEYEAALREAESQASGAEAALVEIQQAVDELNRIREQALGLRRQIQDLVRRQDEARIEQSRLLEAIEQHQKHLDYYQSLVDQAAAIESRHREYQESLATERTWGQKLGQAANLQEERARCESELAAAREEIRRQLRSVDLEETRLNRSISEARAQLTYELGDLRTQDALLTERIPTTSMRAELQQATEHLDELERMARALDEARTHLQEIEVEQSRLEERNRQLREQMEETKTRLETLRKAEADCPLCKQSLSPDHHTRLLSEIEDQGAMMGDEYRANRRRQTEMQKEQEKLRLSLQEHERHLRVRTAKEQAVARLQQQIEQGEEARTRAVALREQILTLTSRIEMQDYARTEQEALAEITRQKAGYEAQLDSEDYAPAVRASLAAINRDLTKVGYDAAAHQACQQQIRELEQAEANYRELEKARVGVKGELQAMQNLAAQSAAQEARLQQLSDEVRVQERELEDLEPRLVEGPSLARRLNEVRQLAVTARQRVGAARQDLAALETLEQRLTSLHEERAALAQEIAIYLELREAFGVNGIPAMIIEHTLPELERDANRILQQLTGGRMHARFETQRETKTGNLRETLDIIISDEKGTRPYESFSGGEQFRINFAIRVALSRMLAQRVGVRLRSLFVDEGFGALDADGRQRLVEAVKAVQNEFDIVLIITHVDELREAFPTQILVTKTGAGSQIEVI